MSKQAKKFVKGKEFKGKNSKKDKFEKTDYGKDVIGRNDIKWIAKDPYILNQLGKPSFANPIGRPLYEGMTLPSQVLVADDSNMSGETVPGILTMNFYYGPGYATKKTDPLNMAAQKLYNTLRKNITGSSRTYGAADLMMSIQAIDSCYVIFNYIKRFFGIYRKWTQRNAYTPRYFFSAANVDYESFIQDVPGKLARLNLLTKQLSVFKIPAGLDLLTRHSTLFSNIYVDGDNNRAQYYWGIPAGYFTWEDQLDPDGSRLSWTWFNNYKQEGYNNDYTIDGLMDILEGMINALHNSTGLINMAGDIEKAFGDNLMTVSTFDIDYEIEYSFHDSWLYQFQNATSFIPKREGASNFFDVRQNADQGLLINQPLFTKRPFTFGHSVHPLNDVYTVPTIINVGNYTATPEIVAENLQLKVVPVEFYGTDDDAEFTVNYQSEIMCGFWITHLHSDENVGTFGYNSYPLSTILELNGMNTNLILAIASLLSEFSFHPHVQFVFTDDDRTFTYLEGRLADTKNYALVDNDIIVKQHTAALYSLYNV